MTKWLIHVQWCVSKASWNKQIDHIATAHQINKVDVFAFWFYCSANWAAAAGDH